MSAITTRNKSVGRICDALGLKHVTYLNINMRCGGLVKITARFNATEDQMNEVAEILGEYELCEK